MKIKTYAVGPIGANCYICYDENTREGMVLDPGGNAELITGFIRQEKLQIKLVVNTHGHGDHIGANNEVLDATGALLYIHAADAPMLTDMRQNLSAFMGFRALSRPADKLLQGGETLSFSKYSFLVLHTPGHSPGGICLVGEGLAFTGDTLFQESIGRCDFPGGSERELIDNVKKKIMVLDDATQVLPGHGPASTVGWERQYNPYLSERSGIFSW